MSKNYINWEYIKAAISDLSTYEPRNTEISSFYDIKEKLVKISNEHEGFLNDGILDNLDVDGGGPVSSLYEVNNMYCQLIVNLKNVLDMSTVDSGGGVDVYDSYGSGGSNHSSSYVSSDLPTSSNLESTDKLQVADNLTDKDYASNYSDFRKTDDGLSTNSSNIAHTDVGGFGGAGSAIVGGALAANAAISGIGDSSYGNIGINYPLGNEKISSTFFSSLSSEEKDSIINKLKEIGYTDEEIEKIMNGEVELPKVLVDTLTDTLSNVYSVSPKIRNEIIRKYGIDIFDENGLVNRDKLAMVLIMDDKSGTDSFSIISMLSDNYGVDIVDMSMLSNYSNRLESLLLSNYDIRKAIIDKYGFDVFNDDGSINSDHLALALLIDKKSNFNVADIMDNIGESNLGKDLGIRISNIKNVKSKSGSSIGIPIGVGFSAIGAGAGIGAVVYNKKKKDKNNDENELIDIEKNNEEKNNEEKNNEEKNKDGNNKSKWIYEIIGKKDI